MDLQELRSKPHLSISAISDYIDCGLLFKFSRVDRLKPQFKADVLVFGGVVHQTLQEYYQCLLEGYRMSFKEIRNHFEHHWHKAAAENRNIRYTKGADYSSMLLMGINLLETWYKTVPNEEYRLVAVEEPFVFTLPGVPIPVIGAIDLIEEDDAGTIIITDHKTPAKAMSDKDVHSNQQLTVYQMAAKNNGYHNRNILLKFDCLIKTKQPKFIQYYSSRTQSNEHRMIRKIQSVWDGISKRVFVPNDLSWKCINCAYAYACKEWFMKAAA